MTREAKARRYSDSKQNNEWNALISSPWSKFISAVLSFPQENNSKDSNLGIIRWKVSEDLVFSIVEDRERVIKDLLN